MAMTLFEYTKKILYKLSGDEVDSIFDTSEAEQVANEVLDTYKSIHAKASEEWTYDTFSFLDRDTYTLLSPDNLQFTREIYYNGEILQYVSPTDFNYMLSQRKGKDGYDADGYGNNADPKCFTSYNDIEIVVDSIDTSIEAAVSGAKSKGYGKLTPTVLMEDDYVPVIPSSKEMMLLHEATGICLNRFREKTASYDFNQAKLINSRNNTDGKFNDDNYLYDNWKGWGYK